MENVAEVNEKIPRKRSPIAPNSRLIPSREAAAVLGIPARSLTDLALRGEIQFVRVGPRLRYFERAELDRWIAAHRERLTV